MTDRVFDDFAATGADRATNLQAARRQGLMVHASASQSLRPRLRVGMVGGGRDAFIGAVHRMAMRLDDPFELAAGALSSDRRQRARLSGADLGLAPDRAYARLSRDGAREAARPDGIEAVVIVTPNHLHYPVAKAFLEAGIDVICDKPLSATSPRRASSSSSRARSGLVFAVTLNNTGYPMVRQAREMIAAGDLGDLRVVHAAYIQDWLTNPIDADGQKQAEWRTDPARAGRVGVSCRHRRARAQSRAVRHRPRSRRGLRRISRPSFPAAGSTTTPMCCCASRAARAAFSLASQVAVGNLNNLSLKVYGTKAGLEWSGEDPGILALHALRRADADAAARRTGQYGARPDGSRMPGGHPEGYIEGFANLYRGAAELVAARRSGRAPKPRRRLTPTVRDGALGLAFIEAAVASSRKAAPGFPRGWLKGAPAKRTANALAIIPKT